MTPWRREVADFNAMQPSEIVGRVHVLQGFYQLNDLASGHGRWARAMALGKRYRGRPDTPQKWDDGVPYHVISAPNSMLYLNLPFDWVTWHGHGANNDFLGWCWDGDSRYDDIPIDDLRCDLEELIERAKMEGHPIEELTVHSAFSNKPFDPGKEFIRSVIEPTAEKLSLKIDYERKQGNGRSIREILDRK